MGFKYFSYHGLSAVPDWDLNHGFRSKRKGLSLEEKRQRMLEFFYEKKDFFQLKEIERMCQKEKGINAMSAKDILMSLVHDGLVDTEKIGTCVYFWSFPSKAVQKRKNTIEYLNEKLQYTKKQASECERSLSEAKSSRENTDERVLLLEKLDHAKSQVEELTAELQSLRKYDPKCFAALQSDCQVAIDAANRWTDNVFVIQSWLTKNFPIDEATFRQQFNIPDSFDYID